MAVCIVIGAILFAFNNSPTKSIFGYRYYTVLTPSMSPNYNVGDVVFVHIEDSDTINEGDVITFNLSADSEAYLTHRVTEKFENYEGSGVTCFRTKGDANDSEDSFLIDEEKVIGKVVFGIPKLGYIIRFVQLRWYYIAAIAVMIIVFIYLLKRYFKAEDDDNSREAEIAEGADAKTDDGYYFVKGTDGAADKYYAIDITPNDSDIYTITAKVKKTKQELINAGKLNYIANSDNSIVYAYYAPQGNTIALDGTGELKTAEVDANNNTVTYTELKGDEIIIDIAVNNDNVIDATKKVWTLALNETDEGTTYKNAESGHNLSFYYNKLLGAGKTAENVIDSITLDKVVKKEAYVSLDYNLKVTVDSAQVVDDRKTRGTAVTAVNEQTWAVYAATYTDDDHVTWNQRSGS